jgi:hypothetical protein
MMAKNLYSHLRTKEALAEPTITILRGATKDLALRIAATLMAVVLARTATKRKKKNNRETIGIAL